MRLGWREVVNFMDQHLSERVRPFFEKVREIEPIIRQHAERAEREAQMSREVADAFIEAGFFRALLPRDFAGAALLGRFARSALRTGIIPFPLD